MAGSQGSAKRSTRARREPKSEEDSQELTGLTAAEAAKAAVIAAADLTGKTPVGVTAVEPTEDGWRVEIEVVEESHIPSTSDLMALYELDLDPDGELIAYRRTRRYIRGRADSTNGVGK